eukprot:GHVL01010132.1.p1 GENE.GHVL01010132.1~~GHVL01010132.1.p1  ORF type:complete len:961 (-),score=129.08 GHVL01010132.1:970-3852(-)
MNTVVRWSAAKGLGRIVMRLDFEQADETIEYIVDSMDDISSDRPWHGGCLALAELAKRGLLLPSRLKKVVDLITKKALVYEVQKGYHISGTNVRDAACYVCWAFARAYTADSLKEFVPALACSLLETACFDREVNCRRAAAAAIQEHVGRQGQFPLGIDIVNIANFFSLSSRNESYLTVASKIAMLKEEYRISLIDHLIKTKVCHVLPELRSLSCRSLALLIQHPTAFYHCSNVILPTLIEQSLSAEVAVRHGSVCAISSIVSVYGKIYSGNEEWMTLNLSEDLQKEIRNVVPRIEKNRLYRGGGGEIVRNASCSLIAEIASASKWQLSDLAVKRYQQTVSECMSHLTESVQVSAANAFMELSRHRFNKEFGLQTAISILRGLIDDETLNIAARRGYALCLGLVPMEVLIERCDEIISALCAEIIGQNHPKNCSLRDGQARRNAVISVGLAVERLIEHCKNNLSVEDQLKALRLVPWEKLFKSLIIASNDYEVDRRGDVGSWIRDVVAQYMTVLIINVTYQLNDFDIFKPGNTCFAESSPSDYFDGFFKSILRLSVEKLDRTRSRSCFLAYSIISSYTSKKSLNEFSAWEIYNRTLVQPGDQEKDKKQETLVLGSSLWEPQHLSHLRKIFCVFDNTSKDMWSIVEVLRGTDKSDEHIYDDVKKTKAVPGASYAEANMSGSLAAAKAAAMSEWGNASRTFKRMVPLLEHAFYRCDILCGLILSVGGLSESVSTESSLALISFLNDKDVAYDVKLDISKQLLEMLQSSAGIRKWESAERQYVYDRTTRCPPTGLTFLSPRVVVPLMKTVLTVTTRTTCCQELLSSFHEAAQGVALISTNVSVLITAVRLFGAILMFQSCSSAKNTNKQELASLIHLLGHSFPKVREAASQEMYSWVISENPDGLHGLSQDQLNEIAETLTSVPWTTMSTDMIGDDNEAISNDIVEAQKKLFADLNLNDHKTE